MGEKTISAENFLMLVDLYNSLKIGFFKKVDKVNRRDFCVFININQNNNITYKKIINFLIVNECATLHDGFSNKKEIEIDSRKLDRLIRNCKYFKQVDEFIFKSSGGLAETGV